MVPLRRINSNPIFYFTRFPPSPTRSRPSPPIPAHPRPSPPSRTSGISGSSGSSGFSDTSHFLRKIALRQPIPALPTHVHQLYSLSLSCAQGRAPRRPPQVRPRTRPRNPTYHRLTRHRRHPLDVGRGHERPPPHRHLRPVRSHASRRVRRRGARGRELVPLRRINSSL